jgi:hypothetical protein
MIHVRLHITSKEKPDLENLEPRVFREGFRNYGRGAYALEKKGDYCQK